MVIGRNHLEKDNEGHKTTEVKNRKQMEVQICPWQLVYASSFAFMNSANNCFIFNKRLQLWTESCANLI